MTRIRKLSISALTALSLTLVPAPATAADGEDIAKVLAGLAVLGLIAKSVDNRRDRKKAAQIQQQAQRRTIEGELRRPDRPNRGAILQNHFDPLPDRCVRVIEGDHRNRLFYGKRCLKRNYSYTPHLPKRCERDVRSSRGHRTVYSARCLSREGWRVAGR